MDNFWYRYPFYKVMALTHAMTAEEFGVFTRLINYQALHGFIPKNPKVLSQIDPKVSKNWKNISHLFSEDPNNSDHLLNIIFTDFIQRSKDISKTNSLNGKKGGLAKARNRFSETSSELSSESGSEKNKFASSESLALKEEKSIEEKESKEKDSSKQPAPVRVLEPEMWLPEQHTGTLLGDMLADYRTAIPTYPHPTQKCFAAARSIADYISAQHGFPLDYANPDLVRSVRDHFRDWWIPAIREHPTWKGKDLAAIARFHTTEIMKKVNENKSKTQDESHSDDTSSRPTETALERSGRLRMEELYGREFVQAATSSG